MSMHNAEQFLLPVPPVQEPKTHKVVVEFKSLADAQRFYSCASNSIRMGHGELRNAALVASISKSSNVTIIK